jgi:arsenate reductase
VRAIDTVTIYHNPHCSKSRRTLALLREKGIEPQIVEYLANPLDEQTIADVVNKLGVPVAQLIRAQEYAQLKLPDTDDDSELIARMAAHPEIIQRPIVLRGEQARLGRPPEAVLEIL